MREGPLAELFRATEAAQRGKGGDPAQQQLPTEEAPPPAAAAEPEQKATPIRAVAPAPEPEPGPEPEPAAERKPLARWLDPLPDQPARLERSRQGQSYLAVIRVVGVGGAGLNAVDRMIDSGITQVDFVAVNTDIQQLQTSDAPTKIHIGSELTEGLGSGSDPEIGRRAADDAYDALTVGIVTMPFKFEGSRRRKQADEGLVALREACDTLIVVPNDRLLEVLDRSTSMLEAFRIADDVLRHGVQGICDLITNPGLINLDFADVRTIMADSGSALMGIGYATGDNRAKEAAERALRSPLIETEITGARGILLSIAGGNDLTLYEVNDAAEAVREAATDDTNIIFGATIDDRLEGQMWITVVATGIGGRTAGRRGTFLTAASGGSAEILEPPSFLRDSYPS
jgi:cell division protein FtsZ